MSTTPNSSPLKSRRLNGTPANGLSFSRQGLLWVLFMSTFFALFLAWNNRLLAMEFNTEAGTYHKAFQVNHPGGYDNTTRSVKQISLIGERNSGTKWMWA